MNTHHRYLLWNAGIFAAYLAAAKLGLKFAVIGETVSLMWPPSGIALAALSMAGYRYWPAVALGAFAANAGGHLAPAGLAAIVAGNTLEPLCGACLLKKLKFSAALDEVPDVFSLILAAGFAATAVAASFGSLGLWLGGGIQPGALLSTWLAWWLGDGMGVLVIAPLLFTGLARLRRPAESASRGSIPEALILLFALSAIGNHVFLTSRYAGLNHFQLSLYVFPFAIWSAMRFGPFGSSGVTLLISLLAVRGTALGQGPFAAADALESQTLWCLFADLIAVTGLILAAVVSGREKALQSLSRSHQDLERLVRTRTGQLEQANLQLHRALAERRGLQLEMNQINEDRQRNIGRELHDGLGQQLTGIGFLIASLQAGPAGKSAPETLVLQQAQGLLSEAISTLRSLSRGLYPVALEAGGFDAALKHLAEHANAAGIPCSLEISPAGPHMDKYTALNLYRIAQEAVSNAVRHSRARQLSIGLAWQNRRYCLKIQDDGVGLGQSRPNRCDTLGLRSMRSRAELIGASIEIGENTGGGSSVIVSGSLNPEK